MPTLFGCHTYTNIKILSREYTVTCTYDPSLKRGSCKPSSLAQAVSDVHQPGPLHLFVGNPRTEGIPITMKCVCRWIMEQRASARFPQVN